MMKRTVVALLVMVLLGLSSSSEARIRVELNAHAGTNTYAFPDIKDDIEHKKTMGWTIDDLDGGMSFGGGLRFFLSDHFIYGLYFRSLAVDYKGEFTGNNSIERKLAANNVESLLLYNFYRTDMFRFYAGTGLDLYMNNVETTLVTSGVSVTTSSTANGYGFLPTLEVQFIISSRFNMTFDASYRYATSSDDYFNWSGMALNAGLSYCLTDCGYPDGLAGASIWYSKKGSGGGGKSVREKKLKSRYLEIGSIKVGSADATTIIGSEPIYYARSGKEQYDQFFLDVAVVQGAVKVLEEVLRLMETGGELDFNDRGELMSLMLRSETSARMLQGQAEDLKAELSVHFIKRDAYMIPEVTRLLEEAKSSMQDAETRIPQLVDQLSKQ